MGDLGPAPTPEMDFTVAGDSGGTVTVTITGELDMSNVDEVGREVARILERRPQRLIADVAGLRFADSSAIALWVQWAAAVDHFELRDPPPLLRRVIVGMGLTERLAVGS